VTGMAARDTYDAIVIGAGHNGLSAAAALAKAGKTVIVLERSETAGGMIGSTGADLAHLIYNMSTKERRRLDLDGALTPLDTISLSPDGAHVVIAQDGRVTVNGAAHPMSATYQALMVRLTRFAGLLAPMAEAAPPAFAGGVWSRAGLRDLWRLGALGLGLKRMGKADMREFLRILLSNAYDLARDELGDGPLSGALTADAVRGAYAGPRSPGTVFNLMYRLGQGGGVFAPVEGMAQVAAAYADAARAVGAEVVLGTGVTQILIEEDKAMGVVTSDGQTIQARAVLSSAGPMQTISLTGVAHHDTETVRRARNHRAKGTAAKVNFAITSLPDFIGLSADQVRQRLVVAPDPDYVERAFNPAKYGELPENPVLEMVVTGSGGTLRLSVIVTHVPTEPVGGWTKAARAKLIKTVTKTIEAFAPDFGALMESSTLVTPADIRDTHGAPGGHWHHGEMGLDQVLTLRPIIGMSRFRVGPAGLYLCGASAHPGGDITGAPGRNAARAVLEDGVTS